MQLNYGPQPLKPKPVNKNSKYNYKPQAKIKGGLSVKPSTPPSMDVPLQGYSNDPYAALGVAPPGGPPSSPASSGPDDARYQSELGAATLGYNDSNLADQNKETAIRSRYGFDQAYADNPLTQANLLQRAADQRFRTTTNSAAARGQLYSGNVNRIRANDEFVHQQQLDTTRRSYADELDQIAQSRLANQRKFDASKDSSYADLLDRFASSDLDPSLYDPGSDGAASGSGTGKKDDKKKKTPDKKQPPKKSNGITSRGQPQKSNLKGKK